MAEEAPRRDDVGVFSVAWKAAAVNYHYCMKNM